MYHITTHLILLTISSTLQDVLAKAENKTHEQEENVKELKELGVTPTTTLLLSAAVLTAIFLALSCLNCFGWIKHLTTRKTDEPTERKLNRLQNSIQQNVVDYLKGEMFMEFPLESLTFGKQQYVGVYSELLTAEAAGIIPGQDKTQVTVKSMKVDAERWMMKAMVTEIKILSRLGSHSNLLTLLGACTSDLTNSHVYSIFQYHSMVNLHDFLKRSRHKFLKDRGSRGETEHNTITTVKEEAEENEEVGNDEVEVDGEVKEEWEADWAREDLGVQTLHCWAFQIALGMEYISSNDIIHCGLTTKSICVTHDNVVKICDFGWARILDKNSEYHITENAQVPMKWLAQETLQEAKYTTKSDIWTFGIILWELFTIGKEPYQGMETQQEVLSSLKEGYRMDKPSMADDKVYGIMRSCWRGEPVSRPDFPELVLNIGELLEKQVLERYMQLSQDKG